MNVHICADGTKVYMDWSEGGHIHIHCACGNDDLFISGNPMDSNDTEVTCTCGKRYSSVPYVGCTFYVNDQVEAGF